LDDYRAQAGTCGVARLPESVHTKRIIMNSNKLIGPTAGLLAALALGACGTLNDPVYGSSVPARPVTTQGSAYPTQQTYYGYGVVHSIERVSQDPTVTGGSGIGLGTVAGAVVGGLVGNQIGGGSGKTAATVLGAAGGGYIGHQIENRDQVQAQPDLQKITVRMSDGSYQAVLQPLDADFRVGDRVRIGDGVLQRY
jgi:outer membrane lipoprotein SlyB